MGVITSKELESNFRVELKELLKKHNAELSVTDDGKPWGLHSGVCEIYINESWDIDGNVISPGAYFRI